MTKIYQTPEVTIMMVQSSTILAGSPGYGGTTDKTDNNLSRGVSWEDDDY
jgi:hypothetical protein